MKKPLVSAVINTLNEEKNLATCMTSLKNLVDEIIVVDMYSDDKTRQIARELGAKVFLHERTGYVEPARNFAISKARGKWILILDADEKIGRSLARKLRELASRSDLSCDFVLVPRKNIIFGKWIQNSRWWPDYLPRFFRRGKLLWPTQIHQKPELKGNIFTLPDAEKFAIIHNNYDSLDQFLDRSRRYAEVQAEELISEKKYKLAQADLVLKPLGEFLSRFFAGEGYKDGIHGLALSILQSYFTALTYLKVWEKQRYEEKPLDSEKTKDIFRQVVGEVDYWTNRWRLGRAKGWRATANTFLFRCRRWLLKLS